MAPRRSTPCRVRTRRCWLPKSHLFSPGPWTPEKKKRSGRKRNVKVAHFFLSILTLNLFRPRGGKRKNLGVEMTMKLFGYIPAIIVPLYSWRMFQRERSSPTNVRPVTYHCVTCWRMFSQVGRLLFQSEIDEMISDTLESVCDLSLCRVKMAVWSCTNADEAGKRIASTFTSKALSSNGTVD